MKLRAIFAALIAATSLTLQAQDWTDVTSTYITDPDFEECNPTTGSLTTGANTKGVSYEDQGWICTTTNSAGTTWSNSAVMNYDQNATNKRLPNNANFPDLTRRYQKIDSNKNGLTFIIGRGTEITYSTKEITLPAGHYVLSVWGRNVNSNSSKTSFPSQLGFVGEKVEYKSTKTSFTAWAWVEDRVEFSLAVPTTGHIQLGGIATSAASTDHAIMVFDHVKLEYKGVTNAELLSDLLTEADDITIPSENIGNGAFEYPAEPINAFRNAIETAQGKISSDAVTEDDVNTMRNAIDAYKAVKDELNRPADGTNYKLQLAYTFTNTKSYLSNGFVTLSYTLTNQGGYTLSIGSSTESFSDESYLAQQFTLTTVEDVQNGYILSMIDKDGNTRYLCSGSKVGGNDQQVRTSINSDDALTIVIQYAGMVDSKPTYRLISALAPANTFIGFTDTNSYCWPASQDNCGNTYYLYSKTTADLPTISLNMEKGHYATRIFPFVRTIEGDLITDCLAEKVNIYTCEALIKGTHTLHLTTAAELKAHTPYIIEAKEDIDLSFTGYGTAYNTKTEYTEGLLTGTYASTGYAPKDSYVLQNQDGHEAFYRVADEDDIHLSPYRVYLTTPTSSDVKGLLLRTEWDEQATGIEEISNELFSATSQEGKKEHNGTVIYDIQGRRLSQLQSGLNVVRLANGNVRKIMK